MANKKRGYYTIKLGGKNRVMHFSMNFWANFTELLNISLQDLGTVFEGGDQEQGNEIDYNEFQVGMWLEDLEADKIEEIVSAMLESRILGNDLNAGLDRNVKKTTKKGK